MITITKKWDNFPFAHRQPSHKGHCRLIHGHNWSFAFKIGAASRDENGFVVDFGAMKGLYEDLRNKFDHTLVLNFDDPELEIFSQALERRDLCEIRLVPNCGAEGLAVLAAEMFDKWVYHLPETVRDDFARRGVTLISVTVYEDDKNSAEFVL